MALLLQRADALGETCGYCAPPAESCGRYPSTDQGFCRFWTGGYWCLHSPGIGAVGHQHNTCDHVCEASIRSIGTSVAVQICRLLISKPRAARSGLAERMLTVFLPA